MNWQEFVRDCLTFTRKERIGILVALSLLFLIFLLPKFSGNKTSPNIELDTSWVSMIKQLEIKEDNKNDLNSNNPGEENFGYQYDRNLSNATKAELFYFDPNTLSPDGWKKLGLRDKTVKTIQNYINKGGRFKKPEDLQKIYGLGKNEFDRLTPYIKIEPADFANKYGGGTSVNNSTETKKSIVYSPRYSIIDINTADTAAFISLPGIGSKLAARIVSFREKLGGFYTIEQIGETYGVPDSTFQKIKPYLKLENTTIRKVNINSATIDELKAHPYIKFSIANPIVNYRNEHGSFTKLEDLKKVMVVTDEIYNKIIPYLSMQ